MVLEYGILAIWGVSPAAGGAVREEKISAIPATSAANAEQGAESASIRSLITFGAAMSLLCLSIGLLTWGMVQVAESLVEISQNPALMQQSANW